MEGLSKLFDSIGEESTQISNSTREEHNKTIDNVALIELARIKHAVNKRRSKEQMRKSLQFTNTLLNEEGKAEILDKDGTTRYNKEGKPLSIDEFVSEFITQNAHFQVATPSGSGSVSNVGKVNAQTFNLSDLDMNNPDDRKKYAELRKQRNAQPTVINLNK